MKRPVARKAAMNSGGFTLVEVIIAIAILGIVFVAIINAFTGSVTNIFIMGDRTQSMAEARAIMDEITSHKDASDTFVQSIQSDTVFEKIDNCSDLTKSFSGYRVRYCVKLQEFTVNSQIYEHTIVTILVFYNDKDYVTLTSSFHEE